jgi:hypothetical protein
LFALERGTNAPFRDEAFQRRRPADRDDPGDGAPVIGHDDGSSFPHFRQVTAEPVAEFSNTYLHSTPP